MKTKLTNLLRQSRRHFFQCSSEEWICEGNDNVEKLSVCYPLKASVDCGVDCLESGLRVIG